MHKVQYHKDGREERFAVTYNKGNYTSVLFQTVQNTGGAHPMTFRNGTIYDMTTGKIQTAADILKCEQKEVDKMVLDGFTAQINAKPELFYENALEELSQAIAHHSYNYYLTEDGLTFFFHPYDIAPYHSSRVRFFCCQFLHQCSCATVRSSSQLFVHVRKNCLVDIGFSGELRISHIQ